MEIREDEHADEQGLPVCNNCGDKRYIQNEDMGLLVRCLCKCQAEEEIRKKTEFEKQQKALQIKQAKLNSLLGKRYEKASFENSIYNESNKKIYDKVKEYAIRYEEMLSKGNGFYIYGTNGIGKTHLLACLCNYLTDHLQICAFTNFMQIAEDIKAAFNGSCNEEDVIRKYSAVKFLFIDDLGKESFKKLRDETSNMWLEEKIFEILNNRYNNKLPTIFSSNYSIQEISQSFKFDAATIDRIVELSTLVFKMTGDNWRYKERKNDW